MQALHQGCRRRRGVRREGAFGSEAQGQAVEHVVEVEGHVQGIQLLPHVLEVFRQLDVRPRVLLRGGLQGVDVVDHLRLAHVLDRVCAGVAPEDAVGPIEPQLGLDFLGLACGREGQQQDEERHQKRDHVRESDNPLRGSGRGFFLEGHGQAAARARNLGERKAESRSRMIVGFSPDWMASTLSIIMALSSASSLARKSSLPAIGMHITLAITAP